MVSAPKRPTLWGTLVLAAALVPGICLAETRKPAPAPTEAPVATPAKSGPVQVGDASWYGKHHQGKRTASGEQFDMRSLTAAHPTLPLGSVARVTNLKNGRWVVVRITDRGPFGKRRVIDVSLAAAEEIGLKRSGVGKVKIEPLRVLPRPHHEPL